MLLFVKEIGTEPGHSYLVKHVNNLLITAQIRAFLFITQATSWVREFQH